MNLFIRSVFLSTTLFFAISAYTQEDVTIVTPSTEAGEGLDLQAVAEIFKDSETLEDFEKALNDPENEINNLDLDENGEVDYIRVVSEADGNTHVIILQVSLGEDDFQDVATIEVEKTDDDVCNMQVHGNEEIYGADYYYSPSTVVYVRTWPIFGWIYGPRYRPYRSVYYWGHYPGWWRPWRPVSVTVYRTRTVRFRTRATFGFTRTTRVHTATRVYVKPRKSTLAVKKTRTVKVTGPHGHKSVTAKKTTVRKGGEKTTTVKVKKTTRTKKGKKTTTVKRKKTTRKNNR